MTLETDEQALARAAETVGAHWPDGSMEADLHHMRKSIEKGGNKKIRIPHSIFFSYMRFNKDGTFHSTNWYHEGNRDPILPLSDPSDEKNLGFRIYDMALHARAKHKSKYQYQEWGRGLEGVKFPARFSYCVYFMDDLNWRFLMDDPVRGAKRRPVVKFLDRKGKKKFDRHKYAFGLPDLYETLMPNTRTGLDDIRQSMIMINRMSNNQGKPIASGKKERYSFDLWMRVRYAGSTSGVTLIIDPGGENRGPPVPPPGP